MQTLSGRQLLQNGLEAQKSKMIIQHMHMTRIKFLKSDK